MKLYTYSEARQKLASLLEQAEKEGEVRIKRKDGKVFVLKPQPRSDSPLDVEGIDLDITTSEILKFIEEDRRSF
jgi:antitoxin Phd